MYQEEKEGTEDKKKSAGLWDVFTSSSSVNLDVVKDLVENGADVNCINRFGETVLFVAVRSGSLEITKYLVDQGAFVNWKSNFGSIPLRYAVQSRSLDIVKYLVEHGADVSWKDNNGKTLLKYAEESLSSRIVKYLVKLGDTVFRTDNKEISATVGPEGGVIQLEHVILQLETGCLTEETEITLAIKPQRNFAPKSLLDLGLVDSSLPVSEFLPHHLSFPKPAVLTIEHERTVSDSQLFILHGSYNKYYQKIIWEVVSNGIESDDSEGVINLKITGFSWYNFILAFVANLPRIVSHFNYWFVCRAYALYRRQPSTRTIDIAVVLISEFVDDCEEKDIKQLNDNFDRGYHIGEKGMLQKVHTDRHLQLCLNFPGVKSRHISFRIDQAPLDFDGYVISDFKGIATEGPENGRIEISYEENNTLLWRLTLKSKYLQETTENDADAQSSATELLPEVVYHTTKLTNGEIYQMSRMIGLDWDCLAGLMDIPYYEREEIRFSHPTFSSRGEQVFRLFNNSQSFDRHVLKKYLDELRRKDLKNILLPMETEDGSQEAETMLLTQTQGFEQEQLVNTPLSSRELCRLSLRLVDWQTLAALLDISAAERENIQHCDEYPDNRSRGQKILSMFNRTEEFTREKLGNCLEEINQNYLVEPMLMGVWRGLVIP